MSEPQIVCPKCRTPIRLTDSLAAPLLAKTRKQFEQRLAQQEAGFAKRETELRKQKDELAKARKAIDDAVARKLASARTTIAKTEAQKARRALAGDLAQRDRQLTELQQHLDANAAKLADAQKAQAAVLRKARELDDAKRELELSVEQRVQQALATVRTQAERDAEARLKAKVTERDVQIAGMQRKIEELRRKATQGSEQLQGEAFEHAVEAALRHQFPQDLIEPVPTGEVGGDILQRIRNATGQLCGALLWELKATKTWNERWLAKLRDDQRAAQAEVALLVSNVLPKGIATFGIIDGVWVTHQRYAMPLAAALRHSLIEVATLRQANDGQRSKMELMYQYLTGPRFRLRIEAIVDKFTDMQADLDRERKAITRIWAKREQQLNAVITSSAGLYGDLQGIAGNTMPEIEQLDVLMIEEKKHRQNKTSSMLV
ncbi:DUF2130 domain-containing protein [Nitrobacteraceae bacterium UC4446_H13]